MKLGKLCGGIYKEQRREFDIDRCWGLGPLHFHTLGWRLQFHPACTRS